MKAIVIKRHLSAGELTAVLRMAESGGHDIFSSVELPAQLSTFNKGAFEIPEGEKKRINYDIMDFVISFGEKEFEGNPVVEWMKFDDSSIWYYHKFRAYFRLRNLKYEIAEVKKLSTEHDSVSFYPSETLLAEEIFHDNINIILPATSSGSKWNINSLFKYFLILKTRWLINLFSFKKLKKPDHIIMDVTKRQAFLDINTLRVNKGNYVIGYLLEKAGNDFLIIDEAVQPKMSEGAKISLTCDHLFGKGSLRGRYFGEPILLNYFLSSKQRKRKKDIIRKLNNNLDQLLDKCEGDEKLLIGIYRSFSGATNFYLIKYLAYRKFFSRYKFKTITTVDENSPAIRCILDAAREEGIKTIGVQHGNIHDLHPAYLYTAADKERKAFPDHSLVWSEFWKEFLIEKGNYKADSLKISGQIRTDVIPKLKATGIGKEEIFPELTNDDKLIVFASQPQRDPQLRRRAAEDVMKAVKATPDGFLLIKLHPNEKNDSNYYANIAKEIGLERIMITLSVDLYLLISVCDILITCFSTVGTETIYFGKPLIILDHLKQDIQNYHKEGVALQAYNEKELEDHIASILNGNTGIDKEACERFISKYAFAIDGKASERTLEFIRGL